jgi:hypothetical protein
MPAYYRSSIREFLQTPASEIFARLAAENASQRFALTPEAIDAWNLQLPFLSTGMLKLSEEIPDAGAWPILLEYPIPQIGKRIDAIILAHNAVLVIETKTGYAANSARRQVEDYALALACFHEASANKKIVPLVVSDAPTTIASEVSGFEKLIRPCILSSTAELGPTLVKVCAVVLDRDSPAIDGDRFDEARFRPIPPIIDAAVKLYAGMDVFEIGHAAAAQEDLGKTTNALLDVIGRTREVSTQRKKAICFVTGVPGAGKTLVGLNAVHRNELQESAMFLSGNGPLVKIIREALIRDVVKREKKTRRAAELALHAFVGSVHRFADFYYDKDGQGPTPVKNVIVFDEAQRAWDAKQNEHAKRPPVSESKMLLEIMDRHDDWAVIVALIGGGQEINRGEAGLAEWGRALAGFSHWDVFASPEVLSGGITVSGFKLFEEPDAFPERIFAHENLHLRVSTRSIRSQHNSDWVNAVLSGMSEDAARIAFEMQEKPFIVRDLQMARAWLNERRIGYTRAGLVASSSATRLRADGIEAGYDFHKFYEWERWFLDRHDCEEVGCDHKFCNDTRASSKLEVCATQFEIQGLELDWVGLCWGEDFVWTGEEWASQKFNSKSWSRIDLGKLRGDTLSRAEVKHNYRRNAYRVLMTRARQGMILYVPEPSLEDKSRAHTALDQTYNFLVACGAHRLNSKDAKLSSGL